MRFHAHGPGVMAQTTSQFPATPSELAIPMNALLTGKLGQAHGATDIAFSATI
jgi:hypothetical protein